MRFKLERMTKDFVSCQPIVCQHLIASNAGDDRGGAAAKTASQRNLIFNPHPERWQWPLSLPGQTICDSPNQIVGAFGNGVRADPLGLNGEDIRVFNHNAKVKIDRETQCIEASTQVGSARRNSE